MGFDNKPNLSNEQFDQKNNNILYLCGQNIIKCGGSIDSYSGFKSSGVTILNTGLVSSSLQIGCNAKANGIASISIGAASCSNGVTSISIGCNTCSLGTSSIAIGSNSKANSANSVVFGNSISNGIYGISIGNGNVCCNGGIAIGDNVVSDSLCGVVIGTNIINNSGCSIGFGWYNGGLGLEKPSIIFSNETSYFYGCGNPLVGFGKYNPTARVDIYANGAEGFRLVDGNQALGKALISDINGFGKWCCIGVISGNTNYVPMFTSTTKLGNSKLKQICDNVFEFQYTGNTIIRGISGTTNSSSIEIHSGVKNGTNVTSPLILKSSEVKVCQPELNKHAKISSAGGTGLLLSAAVGSAMISGEGVYMGICSGCYAEDIMYYPESVSSTLMCIKRPSNFTIQGYTGYETNLDGCNVFIKAGCGNQNEFSNSNGGCVVIKPGIGSGSGNGGCLILCTAKNTYLCNLAQRTNEVCTLFIDNNGKVTYGYNSAAAITGTSNCISKFNLNGNSVIDSTIYENNGVICLGSQTIYLGDVLNDSAVIMQPRVGGNVGINLIIKPGCNNNDDYDGQLYLDPGRSGAGEGQFINFGSDTFNGSFTGIIPHGTENDISLSLRSKNNGNVVINSNGGILLGCTSNLTCINGDYISKLTKRNLCITGHDTNINNTNACSVYIRGGNAIAVGSRGGNLILTPGRGYSAPLAGRIYMCNLVSQSTENKILYIDNTGAISCGISNITTASNGITLSNGNFILGGVLTGNTTISAPLSNYKLNICNGVTLNTQNGYQISGSTILRTPNNTLSSIYIGCNVGTVSGGFNNIGMGENALKSITSGSNNFAVGRYSQHYNQSGSQNISIGLSTMVCNISGNNNISIGTDAMYCNESGCNNISIGYNSLYNNQSGCNNIGIGPYAGYGTNLSNKLYISNSSLCTLIYGEFDNKMVKICGNLCTTGNMCATSFINTSDCRYKTNIKPINNNCLCIDYQEFCFCNDNRIHYGVIAQDIKDFYPELIYSDCEGKLSVSYIDLLIKEISFLKNKVNELEYKMKNIP